MAARLGNSTAAILLVVFVCALLAAQAQPLPEIPTEQLASEAVVVPERQAVGASLAAPAATAAAAVISPEAAATTVAVESNSRAQAARARQQAQSWAPVLDNSTASGPIGTESVCGYNSLVADNSITNCRIVSSFGGTAFSCSAFKIGDNLLGTAGHCIYAKPYGWATQVDVYCTGAYACGGTRTTTATYLTTTPTWMASATNVPTAWDGAVIRTAGPLPGQTFTLGQFAKPGDYSVRLTGYPSQNADPSCGDNAYAGACRQYSSTDVMQVGSSGMYSSSNLDLCRGHSGGGVMTADANRYLVGIVTGASFNPCANYFVPQINSDSGVNGDCERAEGGVSLVCLAAKLPK